MWEDGRGQNWEGEGEGGGGGAVTRAAGGGETKCRLEVGGTSRQEAAV